MNDYEKINAELTAAKDAGYFTHFKFTANGIDYARLYRTTESVGSRYSMLGKETVFKYSRSGYKIGGYASGNNIKEARQDMKERGWILL